MLDQMSHFYNTMDNILRLVPIEINFDAFVLHLKKCSLALYFRRLDSNAEAATWQEEIFSNIGCELIIHLLVDLDSFVVILQSGCVLGNLEGVHVMSLETGKPDILVNYVTFNMHLLAELLDSSPLK